MLNRRILRIKVFKTIYACAENPSMTLAQAQTHFDAQCQGTRDLYLFMLALVPALTKQAKSRILAAKSKFHPTEEEKNPNMKFAENFIAPKLDADPDFTKLLNKKKLADLKKSMKIWFVCFLCNSNLVYCVLMNLNTYDILYIFDKEVYNGYI